MTNGSKNDLGVECTAQNNINIAYFNTTMYNAKGKRRKEWKRMWNFDRDNHRSPWSLCALCCVTRECFKKEEELQLKHTETISIEQSKCFSSPLPSFPLSKFALVFRLNLNFHSVSVWLSVCVWRHSVATEYWMCCGPSVANWKVSSLSYQTYNCIQVTLISFAEYSNKKIKFFLSLFFLCFVSLAAVLLVDDKRTSDERPNENEMRTKEKKK